MKIIHVTLLVGLLTAGASAAEIVQELDVDGKRYLDVRWGPLNQGKVVIYHSRGVAIVPAEKLPAEYQALLGYQPVAGPTPPPAATDPTPQPAPVIPAPPAVPAENKPDPNQVLLAMRTKREATQEDLNWAAYNRDRTRKVLFEGKLVDKSRLKELTGFLIRTRTEIESDERTVSGSVLDLAQRRKDSAPVAQQMELRPSLWDPTGVRVVLLDYSPAVEVGTLIRVFALEDAPVAELQVYRVGKEPSFEQWQSLVRLGKRE